MRRGGADRDVAGRVGAATGTRRRAGDSAAPGLVLSMNRPLYFLGLLAGLVAVIAGGLAWRHRATAALREELGWRKRLLADDERVKARHAEFMAKQVSPAELERRREEHEAWVALAGDIQALRTRLDADQQRERGHRHVGQRVEDRLQRRLQRGDVGARRRRDLGPIEVRRVAVCAPNDAAVRSCWTMASPRRTPSGCGYGWRRPRSSSTAYSSE